MLNATGRRASWGGTARGEKEQRKQEMFERCVFVMSFVGERKRPMKRLFEAARETWHSISLKVPRTSLSKKSPSGDAFQEVLTCGLAFSSPR